MDELINILMGKNFPMVSAMLMGFIVSISPCTLVSNFSALTLSLKDETEQPQANKLFVRGIVYTVGRSVAYALLGVLFYYFTSGTAWGEKIQYWIGMLAGPLFILISLLMLDVIHIHGLTDRCFSYFNLKERKMTLSTIFVVGFMLAFAVCPYCASVYFGLMLPLSLSVSCGLLVPILFAVGAAVPVLFLAWVLAYSAKDMMGWLRKFSKFELWFRRFLGLLFLVSGILFVVEYYFE